MPTIAQYLKDSLAPLVDTIFGLPGDYVLNLYHQLSQSFDVVTTTDEQGAGFAADAYARVKGFGVVCVTYCVGGFKIINPIAGAYAEKSPVLVISGAPGVKERNSGLLLHHAAGAYECQRQIFQNIVCASATLDDPMWASYEIDRVIETILHTKQPGYIEIPRDMVDRNVKHDIYTQGTHTCDVGDSENLAEAVEKASEWINTSKTPVILAGVEVARFNLGNDLMRFAEQHNIPVATTILGKSVVNEMHPLSLGIYAGDMSKPHVKSVVENSDCVLMFGVMQTDMNLAFRPFVCNQTNVILANMGRVRIRRSTYEQVNFDQFLQTLFSSKLTVKLPVSIPSSTKSDFVSQGDAPIKASRLFEKINSILSPDIAIIADVGDSLLGASDLVVHHSNQFLAPAFYASMGNAIPGALGVHLALPSLRPLVIVGDGAFQMTGMELSTIIERGLNPIVFILNNGGYKTERLLGPDGSYNDIALWNYHQIPTILGGGEGYLVQTERELECAVTDSLANKKSASIINVIIGADDATPALLRMSQNAAHLNS